MFEIPFHRLSASPRTPFWEVMLALVEMLGLILVLGGDADTDQITADGATFYRPNRGGGRDIPPGAIPGFGRLPLLDMLGPLPELYAKRGRPPAELKVDVRGRKQGRYRHGFRTGRYAVTADSPVGGGETDAIIIHAANSPVPTVELKTSNPAKRARVATAVTDERTGRTELAYDVDVQLVSDGVARVMPRGPGLLVTQAGPPQPFDVRIRSAVRGDVRESRVTLTPGAAGETLALLPEHADTPHGPLVVERWTSAGGGVLGRSVVNPS